MSTFKFHAAVEVHISRTLIVNAFRDYEIR